ncbi:hypothetical protein VNI00_004608 [Paramarasmius palmivorus]|uniref:F-box domain-containing protein n=1 Tax=Paramarasmius palmivorus TaxID=297713 RepID=A0AAW0DJQ6_9AGAR
MATRGGNQTQGPEIQLCSRCNAKFVPYSSYAPVPSDTLRSNRNPLSADISGVMTILEDEEHDLQHYEDEIERYRLVVRKLEAGRDELRRRIEERRSWMAPVRRLPVEILQDIFTKTCNTGFGSLTIHEFPQRDDEQMENYVLAPALTLSHVSTHWRYVACGLKALWASVMLMLDDMTRDLRPLINIYFMNASDQPLKIHIGDFESKFDYLGHFSYEGILLNGVEGLGQYGFATIKFLVACFPRCQELVLDIPSALLASSTQERVVFPLLHTFALDQTEPMHDHNGVLVNRWFWDAIHTAPLLRKLHLYSPRPAFHDYIPWERLTSLSVDFVEDFRHLWPALARCSRLESFDMNEVAFDAPRDSWQAVTVFPHIRSLSLGQCSNVSHTNRMIASFTVPALRKLQVFFQHSRGLALSDFQPLHSMCQRSCWSITTLKLFMSPLLIIDESFRLFSDILIMSPSLEVLKVRARGKREWEIVGDEIHPTDSFIYNLFYLLLPSPNRQMVLPRLKKVVAAENYAVADLQTAKLVLDLLAERSAVDPSLIIAKLQTVEISFDDEERYSFSEIAHYGPTDQETSSEFTQRLARLEDDGISCTIDWDCLGQRWRLPVPQASNGR